MISVIIPIYNSAPTLRRCVDSVIRQTERNLEMLLIDDGSTDSSGAIADAYRRDPRVRVFHKENGGLSSARNYGLDRANGDYVAFVDADDWIEPETFETALRYCEDLCVFGRAYDYPRKSTQWKPVEAPETIDREEALRRLIIDNSIGQTVWNKLYRRCLFDGIRFPNGAIFEDIRTTYRIMSRANRVALIPNVFYHYVQYEGSLVHDPTIHNCLDHWTATYELFCVFGERDEAFRNACILKCAGSIYRVWGRLWKTDRDTRSRESKRISEISLFAKQFRRFICCDKHCDIHHKTAVMLASTGSRWSQLMVCFLYMAKRIWKPEHLYKQSTGK